MLHDPQILILDEPTSGLDPNQLSDIRALIRELGQQKTVIFSTHILQEVTAVCKRLIIIHNGQIVANDSLENLQKKADGSPSLQVTFKQEVRQVDLEGIPGVGSVTPGEGNRWQIEATEDVSEQVFAFAVTNKLTVVELKTSQRSLENIFSELTQ